MKYILQHTTNNYLTYLHTAQKYTGATVQLPFAKIIKVQVFDTNGAKINGYTAIQNFMTPHTISQGENIQKNNINGMRVL